MPAGHVDRVWLPGDTRAEVVAIGGVKPNYYMVIRVQDARKYLLGSASAHHLDEVYEMWRTLDKCGGVVFRYLVPHMSEDTTPLVDNWTMASVPMKRSQLPTGQRRSSYKMRPNSVSPPSPPGLSQGTCDDWRQWLSITYAPGTPVMVRSKTTARGFDKMILLPGDRLIATGRVHADDTGLLSPWPPEPFGPPVRPCPNRYVEVVAASPDDSSWAGRFVSVFNQPVAMSKAVRIPFWVDPDAVDPLTNNWPTRGRMMRPNPRCPSCGGVSHPASGSVLPSGEVVCGPCVRRFWAWASEHGKKTYRVGKKGKGSKYIAFPTGITKKNPQERDCIKCGGSGRIPQFGHYAEGVCFDCGGTGVARKGGRRGPALPPTPPEPIEKKIERTVWDLRTAWNNYTVHRREGQLNELWFNWSNGRYNEEWDRFIAGERKTKPAPPSEDDGKRYWLGHVQILLDDLRKFGAGAKADEIAKQFQSRLRMPVKNRRRTSRRRTSRRR